MFWMFFCWFREVERIILAQTCWKIYWASKNVWKPSVSRFFLTSAVQICLERHRLRIPDVWFVTLEVPFILDFQSKQWFSRRSYMTQIDVEQFLLWFKIVPPELIYTLSPLERILKGNYFTDFHHGWSSELVPCTFDAGDFDHWTDFR